MYHFGQTMWFMMKISFCFGSRDGVWGAGVSHRVLYAFVIDLNKISGAWMNFPHRQYFLCLCSHSSLLGELNVSPCDSNARRHLKLIPGISWTMYCSSFPLANLDLYLFTRMNLNITIKAFLSSLRPSGELLGVRIV